MKKAISWTVVLLSVLGSCWWIAYVGTVPGPAFGVGWSDWIPVFRRLLLPILCLAATYIALRHRSWLASLFQATVALLGIWLAYWSIHGKPEHWRAYQDMMYSLPWPLLPAICLLIVPGVFWCIRDRTNWPIIISKPLSVGKTAALLFCLLLATAIGAATFDFTTIWSNECHNRPQPFTKQQEPDQAVFIARILRSGKLWGPDSQIPSPRRYWSLAWVHKHFWGLPLWDRKLVVLIGYTGVPKNPFPRGEIDFVDGRRLPGSLTRFLPIYETFCTRTGPLADSEIDLRVLRDGSPQNGTRIMGRTERSVHVSSSSDWDTYRWETIAHAKVFIRGPAGITTVESDEHGVYDVIGLPPGHYEVGPEPADGVPPGWRDVECHLRINAGEICDCGVGFH